MCGGWDETKAELDDLWEFRVRTASWTRLPTVAHTPGGVCPAARTGAVLVDAPGVHAERRADGSLHIVIKPVEL